MRLVVAAGPNNADFAVIDFELKIRLKRGSNSRASRRTGVAAKCSVVVSTIPMKIQTHAEVRNEQQPLCRSAS